MLDTQMPRNSQRDEKCKTVEQELRDSLRRQIKDLQEQLEQKDKEIKGLEDANEAGQKLMGALTKECKERQATIDKLVEALNEWQLVSPWDRSDRIITLQDEQKDLINSVTEKSE